MFKIVKGNNITDKQKSKLSPFYEEELNIIEKTCFTKKQNVKKVQDDLNEELHVSSVHSIIFAAHVAFCYHKNLEIHPEDIHLLITHQIGKHINLNSEKYRKLFTKNDKKENIILDVPIDIIKNKKEFIETIYKFCDNMNLNDNIKDLFESDFSTSTENDKLCSKMSLMNTASKYYDYTMCTKCGIPEFHIYGTIEDWKKLKNKIQILDVIDLGEYKKKLENFLDEVILSYTTDNNKFWINYYKFTEKNDFSGSIDKINGHILKLFWYDNGDNIISSCDNFTKTINAKSFNQDYKIVDIDWLCLGKIFHYKLISGFMGVFVNDKNNSLKPISSWILYETN